MNRTYRKADLHVHSSESHDVPEFPRYAPRALFEHALGHPQRSRRMDYFALTDHDTMAGYEKLVRELPESDRSLVIPGVEHAILDPAIGFTIHVNLYRIHPDQYAHIRQSVRTLDELAGFCREAGIRMLYNHPTWWEQAEIRAGQVNLLKVRDATHYFDVLELNAGRTRLMNDITRNIARATGKHLIANSDTHTGEVGRAHTEARGDTADEFLNSLWTGQSVPHAFHMTSQSILSMVHAAIDELFSQQQGVRIKPSAMDSGHPRIENLARRLLSSHRVMGHRPLRVPLRLFMRQVARLGVWRFLEHERALEQSLRASELFMLGDAPSNHGMTASPS
jgi:predicted metal-dependent phosphoesterase TrpH